MYTRGTKRLSLAGALGTAAIVSAYVAWSALRGHVPPDALFGLHQFVLSVLLATWLIADTKESRSAQPSLDLGWLILLTFPVYSGCYLISTRRWPRGLLMLVGMVLLVFLPRVVAWYVS